MQRQYRTTPSDGQQDKTKHVDYQSLENKTRNEHLLLFNRKWNKQQERKNEQNHENNSNKNCP